MTSVAESIAFEKTLARCGVTPRGAQWLKMAVDPFHDVDLDIVGFPDPAPGRSFVTNVTKNITVQAPGGVAYDAHIAFVPHETTFTGNLNGCSAGLSGGNTSLIQETSRDMVPGIIKIDTVASGNQTFNDDAGQSSISIADQISRNSQMWRVIGCAFEVHNTTAPINRSGAVTVYRYAVNHSCEDVDFQTAVNTHGVKRFDVLTGPPTSEASAKIMNGVTWKAEDGCLVPCLLDGIENRPQNHIPRKQAVKIEYNDDSVTYFTPTTIGHDLQFVTATGATAAGKSSAGPPSSIFPFMGCGAYFTGLSAETTLTVTLRCFVEIFPMPGDPFMSIARPSPSVDIKALQCYSEIVSSLLPGYPVHDNSAGDFFRKIYKAAKSAADMAAHVPQLAPFAEAASAGFATVDEIGRAIKQLKTASKSKKNKKTKPKISK